jgi:hypothetical protein
MNLMSGNNASEGTIYLDKSSILVMVNATLFNNTALKGAAVIAKAGSNVTVTNTSFKSNVAIEQGTLYMSDEATFQCNSCNISSNRALKDSSVLYGFQASKDNSLRFENSFIHNNRGQANTFNLLFSRITVNNTLIRDNVCNDVSHGLTAYNSVVRIDRTLITYTKPDITLANTNCDYGFFNVNFKSKIYINNSTLSNLRGKIAAAFNA